MGNTKSATKSAKAKASTTKSNIREPNYEVVAHRLDGILREAMDSKNEIFSMNEKIIRCAESLLSYEDGYERVSQIMDDFKTVDLNRSLLLARLLVL
jgi:hypothetical protein